MAVPQMPTEALVILLLSRQQAVLLRRNHPRLPGRLTVAQVRATPAEETFFVVALRVETRVRQYQTIV
ncbi:hypothetical protein HY086_02135 [Candidatus Gottesmanbacteria bacterium]|nr:hypothetical protein [Candidatus Gottesmanbacteria bacterium]